MHAIPTPLAPSRCGAGHSRSLLATNHQFQRLPATIVQQLTTGGIGTAVHGCRQRNTFTRKAKLAVDAGNFISVQRRNSGDHLNTIHLEWQILVHSTGNLTAPASASAPAQTLALAYAAALVTARAQP